MTTTRDDGAEAPDRAAAWSRERQGVLRPSLSADICRYLRRYLVTPANICSPVKTSNIGINTIHRWVLLPFSFLWENEKKCTYVQSCSKNCSQLPWRNMSGHIFSPVSPKQVPNVFLPGKILTLVMTCAIRRVTCRGSMEYWGWGNPLTFVTLPETTITGNKRYIYLHL
jgi:hypothetical protein